jgi:hypothetical protein
MTATQNAGNGSTMALLSEVERLLSTEGISDAVHSQIALKYLGNVVEAQANTLGFQDGFLWVAIAATASLLPATVMMLQRRRRS